jgi:alpha/beta hydrolase fold
MAAGWEVTSLEWAVCRVSWSLGYTRGKVLSLRFEYRLSGEALFLAQIQDVKAAIRWLRSRASDYGIDPTRAMTWGVSTGAFGGTGCCQLQSA